MIGTMNNKNLNSENYPKINKIIVTGLDVENNLRLVKSLNFLKFSNLFFINKIQITEIIDSNNSIEQYSIFKKYPSSLEIKISKAKFLAKIFNFLSLPLSIMLSINLSALKVGPLKT